jgi:hypothetical protein
VGAGERVVGVPAGEGVVTNREFTILNECATRHIGVTVWDVFHLLYKSSKQPARKCAGIWRTLENMTRKGWLWNRGSNCQYRYTEVRFVMRREGQWSLDTERARRGRIRRPTFPRLAAAFGHRPVQPGRAKA